MGGVAGLYTRLRSILETMVARPISGEDIGELNTLPGSVSTPRVMPEAMGESRVREIAARPYVCYMAPNLLIPGI